MKGMQGERYSDIMAECRQNGRAMPFSYEEFSAGKVVQRLKNYLDGAEMAEMLWLLKREERVEKGIYAWNRPEADLAIVAPPFLMAFIMGEYKLARQIYEKKIPSLSEEWVSELYQEKGYALLGGGRYNFPEAWLLSRDMSAETGVNFSAEARETLQKLWEETLVFLEEFQFHRVDGEWYEDNLYPLRAVWSMCGENEELREWFMVAVVKYLLDKELDLQYEGLWQEVFEAFTGEDERFFVIQVAHGFFFRMCSASNLPPWHEERLLKVLQSYFQYEDSLEVSYNVGKYLRAHMEEASCTQGKKLEYLYRYLWNVKTFGGSLNQDWEQGMLKLLETGNRELIMLCFGKGYLLKECIQDYIDYLLQEGKEKNRNYVVPVLIQLMWNQKES